MAANPSGGRVGLFASLKIFAATLLSVSHTRLNLLSTELEEEREYFLSQLVLILETLFLLGVGLILATILLVWTFWETHRFLVLSMLTGSFLVAGLVTWGAAWRKAQAKPRPFAASLAELFKDRQQIDPRQ
ncbi:MAG: phage holin family protein [Ferrovum sp.]|nr:phage holin family protein [Ferrovum sp.]NDU87056.1 phage holin family protein [Ferrovum sp.]